MCNLYLCEEEGNRTEVEEVRVVFAPTWEQPRRMMNGEDQVEVPRHPEIHEKLARYAILRIAERNPGPRRG